MHPKQNRHGPSLTSRVTNPPADEEALIPTMYPRGVAAFNALPRDAAVAALRDCCTSTAWTVRIADARPFPDVAALLQSAESALAASTEADIDDALAGHPRIGERSAHASSQREQSGVTGADASVLHELARANAEYEERFGHVYLVFADGRPAAELLAVLRERMTNDPATERRVLRVELAKINRVRLRRMLAPDEAPTPGPAHDVEAAR